MTDVFTRAWTAKTVSVFVFLMLPLLAYGSIFSFIGPFPIKELLKEDKLVNSQTVTLLEAPRSAELSGGKGGGEITVVDGAALLPDSGPSGTLADIDELPPGGGQISVYVVRKGDTLSSIAKMFGVTVNTIVWANNLNQEDISLGKQLIILPVAGVQHTIVKGDTIDKVAKKYKADVNDILIFNNLAITDELPIGEELLIPDGQGDNRTLLSSRRPAPGQFVRGKASRPLFVFYQNSAPIGFFSFPVPGGYKTQGLHGYNGVDIGAPRGTPILAAAGGTVIVARADGWNGGYGKYVVIQHDNNTQTLYAHTSKVYVRPGDVVSQGQLIAAIGSTGRSTGPHLHFEVRGAKNPF